MREKEPTWNRRDLVTTIIGGAMSTAYLGHMGWAGYEALREPWKHEGIQATLDPAPWGGKCTIVYEVHGEVNEQAKVPADVLTLEGISEVGPDGQLGTIFGLGPNAELMRTVNDNVWLVDIAMDSWLNDTVVLAESAARGFMAYKLLTGSLPLGIAGPVSAALVSDVVSQHVAKHLGVRSVTSMTNKIDDSLPNSPISATLLDFRNLVVAEKHAFLTELESQRLGKPVHLASVWGAGHGALETDMLRTSAERLDLIKAYSPFVLGVAKENSHLWTCRRLNPENQIVQTLEVPTLKALFAGDN